MIDDKLEQRRKSGTSLKTRQLNRNLVTLTKIRQLGGQSSQLMNLDPISQENQPGVNLCKWFIHISITFDPKGLNIQTTAFK